MASSSKSDIRPWLNKGARAKLAKETINTTIPALLKSHPFALNGLKNTELIRYSPIKQTFAQSPSASTSNSTLPSTTPSTLSSSTPSTNTPPRIRIMKSDTLDAVQSILKSSTNPKTKVCALNMASCLRPGGGVLRGAVAQEESLCMRSTLYLTLNTSFYRLPEDALIYSPSVLVFRDANNADLPKAEWFYTDVVSCAALRNPDCVKVKRKDGDGEKEEWTYEHGKDRECMVLKARHILQTAKEKGVTHLVLGALGCGAYHNPPEEVARIFRREILGGKGRKGVEGIEEISFAIFDEGVNLRVFREVFSDVDVGSSGL